MSVINDEWGVHTYAEFMNRLGDAVLCNAMADRDLTFVSGRLCTDDDGEPSDEGEPREVFQWFIVADASFAIEHSHEPVWHDDELDLDVVGVCHFGTSWDLVAAPELH